MTTLDEDLSGHRLVYMGRNDHSPRPSDNCGHLLFFRKENLVGKLLVG